VTTQRKITPERVRELLEAATSGPWGWDKDGWLIQKTSGFPDVLSAGCPEPCCHPENIRAIEARRPSDAELVSATPDIAAAYLDQAAMLAEIAMVCKQFPGMATGKIRKILEGRNG